MDYILQLLLKSSKFFTINLNEHMKILNIATSPYSDQIAGTSGLRRRTKDFLQENYLENYTQAIFSTVDIKNKTLVIGGDGRFYNLHALKIIVSMGIANGAKKIYVAQNGYLSTPAASIFIRKYKVDYGIILSASHNPAGIHGDFGIKLNESNGAPAHISITNKITKYTKNIKEYFILDDFTLDISKLSNVRLLSTEVEVFNGVDDYIEKMQEIFDFQGIKKLISTKKLQFFFNALHGITGIYAYAIFHKCFNVPMEHLFNIVPKEDFGGLVADPNPTTVANFIKLVKSQPHIDLGFACDADGDRNMIFSPKHSLEPSDSIALMLEHANLVSYYKNIVGVARSKPTSYALDLVAKNKGVPCYCVPTGWKFFANLLDENKITLCGEESFGTGSNHSREKDGIWAILYWLHILAKSNKSFDDILEDYWHKYGRVFFARYDIEDIELSVAKNMLQQLEANAKTKLNKPLLHHYSLTNCQQFVYNDSLSGEVLKNQGLILSFNQNAEVFIRLSGTSTKGSTIRCYVSCYTNNKEDCFTDKFQYLEKLVDAVFSLMPQVVKYTFRV